MVFISILKKLSKPNLGFNPKRHSNHYCYTFFIYRFNRYSNTSEVKVAYKATHFLPIQGMLHGNAMSYNVNALVAIYTRHSQHCNAFTYSMRQTLKHHCSVNCTNKVQFQALHCHQCLYLMSRCSVSNTRAELHSWKYSSEYLKPTPSAT